MPDTRNMEGLSRHPKKEKREAGFTIIEVLIAISLLAIGILAIAKMQIMAMQGNASARWQSEQTTYAQDKMEELMALSYTHADLDTGTHTEPSPPDYHTITWTVSDSTVGFPVPETKLITVTVTGSNKTTVLTGIKPDF